jgi:type III pantothenate kinase
MLLAIDIGNSSIKFGIFDRGSLFHKFSIQTKRDYTAEELMFDRLKLVEDQFIQVDIAECIVASVVPELNTVFAQVCRELFKVTTRFVDASWDLGLNIKYDEPETLGADRLVNAYAAVRKYGAPSIICSFGTATTIDAVNGAGDFLGGVIAPGLLVSAKALQLMTAKLPNVAIEMPRTVFGTNTTGSIQAGVVLGHAAMADGVIRRMLLETAGFSASAELNIIATGGFAHLIAPEVPAITQVDENLALEGLRMLAEGGESANGGSMHRPLTSDI